LTTDTGQRDRVALLHGKIGEIEQLEAGHARHALVASKRRAADGETLWRCYAELYVRRRERFARSLHACP